MRPIFIYGELNKLLKHFFTIVQTKTLFCNDLKEIGQPTILITVSNVEELHFIFDNVLSCHSDRATPIKLLIVYCGFDIMYELSKAKDQEKRRLLEKQTLEDLVMQKINKLKKPIQIELVTAANFLKDYVPERSLLKMKDEKEQRNYLVEKMIQAFRCEKKQEIVGHVSFHWSAFFNQDFQDDDDEDDVVFFDKSFSEEEFVSCLLIPSNVT